MPRGDPVLAINGLETRFRTATGTVTAVDNVSLELHPGETLAIIGESGSGKTVSSRALMGLLPETAHVAGSAKFESMELIGLSDQDMRRHRGSNIAMVLPSAPAEAGSVESPPFIANSSANGKIIPSRLTVSTIKPIAPKIKQPVLALIDELL